MTDTTEYLIADAARKLVLQARTLDGAYLKQETTEILKLICAASTKGKSCIVYRSALCHNEVIHSRLRQLGYSLSHNKGSINPCDPYLEISW